MANRRGGEDQDLAARRGGHRPRSNNPQTAPPSSSAGPASAPSSNRSTVANRGRHGASGRGTYVLDPEFDSEPTPAQTPVEMIPASSRVPSEIPETETHLSSTTSDRPQALPAADPSTQLTARDHVHPSWFVRGIIYMVGFLHTRHRVTFRACGLILVCLAFIFSAVVGNFMAAGALPRTLTTVFGKLGIRDEFVVHPVCFNCHYIFDPSIGTQTFCPDCEEEVFGPPPRDDSDAWDDLLPDSEDTTQHSPDAKQKPQLVAPIQLLSTGLQSFFKRPGMVSAVNSWRKRPRNVTGELKCMQDAAVWNSMQGPDGKSFFYGPGCNDEIRLGVSFSLDWFGRSKSSFGPSHSSGVMSFCVQNLGTSLR
ncbi:hypothetical protein DFH06DRAFT_51334 [Mycena polygramma]|nr:hypothetical protein DFH06DRAFT_51334 [Mycena polygramma]